MKQQFLIYGLIAVVIILLYVWRTSRNKTLQPDLDDMTPTNNTLSTNKVENDKLVIVENASENEMKKILQDFCNSYNKENYQAILHMTKLSETKFAITFPYDVDFKILCFFVNYVSYPTGFDKHFITTGWATTKPNDTWITELSANKNVILFISHSDNEYDNVFMTTLDSIGYKLGFAMGEEKQLLNKPDRAYTQPPIEMKEIQSKPYFEFK